MIGTIINGQLVILAIKGEFALTDSIGVSTSGAAKMLIGFRFVTIRVVKAEYNIF